MTNLPQPGRTELVYTFICSYIERRNIVPQIANIMIGGAAP